MHFIKIDDKTVEIILGNITQQDTDAIVNAANNQLSPGGGVSGAIHLAAGKKLWEESKKLGGCKTGEAKITSGCNLNADYVIHTVGPVYSGIRQDRRLLESSYRNSLKLAAKNKIKNISFPAISTGIFGYPVKEAAHIALSTVIYFLKNNTEIELVRFVLFNKASFEIHKKEMGILING